MKRTLVLSLLSSLLLISCGSDDTKLSDGESCTKSNECQSDFCDGICKPKPTQNNDNDKLENGKSCAKNSECQSDYCDGTCKTKPEQNTDKEKLENGEVCLTHNDCKSGICSKSICSAENIEDTPDPRENGESCFLDTDCKSQSCGADYQCTNEKRGSYSDGKACNGNSDCKSSYCNQDKVCATKSLLDIGDICSKNEQCASNYCHQNSSTCLDAPVSGLANGTGCFGDEECLSGYCGSEYVCENKPTGLKDGETCHEADECASGYCDSDHTCAVTPESERLDKGKECKASSQCKTGVCDKICIDKPADPLEDGEKCTMNSECFSGYCNGTCQTKTPTPELAKNGAECTNNAECQSGYCPNGVCVSRPYFTNACKSTSDCKQGEECELGVCFNKSYNITCANYGIFSCRYGNTCKSAQCSTCKSDSDCAGYEEEFGGKFMCAGTLCKPKNSGEIGAECTTNKQCQNNLCLPSGRCGVTQLMECTSDSDCDRLGINLQCSTFSVAAGKYCTLKDPCDSMSCPDGAVCTYGRCITKDMLLNKTCKDGDPDFVVSQHIFRCENGVLTDENCKDSGDYSIAAIYEKNGKQYATCTYSISSRQCLLKMSKPELSFDTMCSTNTMYSSNLECIEDVYGLVISVDNGNVKECTSGQKCDPLTGKCQ